MSTGADASTRENSRKSAATPQPVEKNNWDCGPASSPLDHREKHSARTVLMSPQVHSSTLVWTVFATKNFQAPLKVASTRDAPSAETERSLRASLFQLFRSALMAPTTSRNGAFSPTRSSAASYTGIGQSRLNIVSRLAIEGKVKQNAEGASIKLYLKITVPIDSVNSGQIIPIFAEENIKIRDYSVHPLDSDSVPYNFSSTSHPLLHNAARALNLPARSSKSYLSLFDTTPQNTPGRNGSINGSAVPTLEERFTGYFLISGYNVCYVLPKEFPAKYKIRGGTDSESDVLSARGMQRTSSYRSGSSGRRHSIGERNTMQFMAGMSLSVPFSSKPPKAPYMLSIPIPRCLSNNIKVRLPSPSSISTSFASLESDEDSTGWDVATEPHVTRVSPLKHSSRTSAYTEFADDESSEASLTGSALENCMIQGTFTSADTIRIRWATPLRAQDYPDGRRRVGVDEVAGNMTCTVLETRADGVKMRLDYQGTCSGVWFPGVATMLGMDVGLDTQGGRLTWPPDSDGQWTIDGDPALTGFTVGMPQTTLSPQPTLELPPPDISGQLDGTIPNGPVRNPLDTSTSLLRAPLPNRRASVEYSFEESLNGASVPSLASSAIRSSDPESGSENIARPPATPITVHINMNELAPAKNKLTLNISGTVLIAPGPGMHNIDDSGQTTLPLPLFRVFAATKENVITTIRNQCDSASVELINSGSASSGHNHSPRANQSLTLSGSRAKKTVVPSGSQAKCASPEGSEILVKPNMSRSPMTMRELSPQTPGRSAMRAASQPSSPEPVSAVLRSQGSRLTGFRDGPLVIPWANCDIVPLVSLSSAPVLSRSTSSKQGQSWSYAVTLSLPTPVDGPSEWLEFGLAMPGNLNASELPPAVEVRCTSVNGVPVRFETFTNPRTSSIDLIASTSSAGAGSTETIDAIDANVGKRKWLSWVRVHIALAGALEVVYIVKGQTGHALSDKKGKQKAASAEGLGGDEVNVFVPVFSIPVSRFEISLRRSSDITIPKADLSGIDGSDHTLHRKIYSFDVAPFTQPHADLIMPHPILTDRNKPSRTVRSAKRALFLFATILPYILSLVMLSHTISTRSEVRELRALVPDTFTTTGRETESWGRKPVTVTRTVVQAASSKPTTASERGWFGEYTMSYSSPTQRPKASSPPQPSPITDDDDEVFIEDISDAPEAASRGNRDERGDESTSLMPILYLPLSWPAQIHFQQAKAQVLSGWGRIWHVVEIILHWPLPVDDTNTIHGSHLLSVRHSESRTSSSSEDTSIRVAIREYPGSGTRTLEEEVCVLDSGVACGGKGGTQGTMGGERGGESFGGVGKRETTEGRREQLGCASSSGPNGWMFWPDAQGMGADEVEWKPLIAHYEHVYERVGNFDSGLGDVSEEVSDKSFGISRCFNCGDPEHTVRSCPEPLNHALISLSRALFQFLHQSSGDEPERFHVAEDWKLQRLRWLEDFEPGVVRNEALKEALGLSEGVEVPWLYNMLEWGYPPGWVSEEDPRELMFKRIIFGGNIESVDDELGEFSIFGEDGDEEVLNLRPVSVTQDPDAGPVIRATNSNDSITPSTLPIKENSSPSSKSSPATRRWATYQTSLFSSDLLPVYNRRPLPPLDDDIPGAAAARPRSEDKQGCNLESGDVPIEHPWRHPDAFSAFGPVGWTKAYEKMLARRAQVEQDAPKMSCHVYNENRTSKTEVSSAHRPVTTLSSPEGSGQNTEDDMDLSD
ncbi:uncharacterized protein FOMMEDRAFT_168705 [Fomitiporia mediterranea MF3/22]|uniref:uncharacterized protein n=1 Tax=Fomitiporia mediterranea (strain MF3/22) TaxID=694068 RepID=UPI0004409556|nr:uncharacterized protein FOMMEDRAFT_168705 [Fomitiporia mediterranea MF3/22]EJD02185.1 hypothetical protein FOMMEDRAFT_168705 [Fomitiporia mediterranea MF3/22]